MILATLKAGGRDGTLIVVNPERTHAVVAGSRPRCSRRWIDGTTVSPVLACTLSRPNCGRAPGRMRFRSCWTSLAAPLPRAYAFLDGSAYHNHMAPIRQVRGAKVPDDFFEKPLMYQGLSDKIIGPTEPILLREDEAYGIDIEAEIVVITGDVPQGVTPAGIRVMCCCWGFERRVAAGLDPGRNRSRIRLRAGQIGQFDGPVRGDSGRGRRAVGRQAAVGFVPVHIRGELIGDLDPGKDATFNYADLIAHAAKTRELDGRHGDRRWGAGQRGAPARLRLHRRGARARAPGAGRRRPEYLRFGDRLKLEFFDREGRSVFGAIDQTVAILLLFLLMQVGVMRIFFFEKKKQKTLVLGFEVCTVPRKQCPRRPNWQSFLLLFVHKKKTSLRRRPAGRATRGERA
jgi:fumarylacetoacetate (FAA) hydrolase